MRLGREHINGIELIHRAIAGLGTPARLRCVGVIAQGVGLRRPAQATAKLP